MNTRQHKHKKNGIITHHDGEPDDKGQILTCHDKNVAAIITTGNRTTRLLSAKENEKFIRPLLKYLDINRPRYLLGADLAPDKINIEDKESGEIKEVKNAASLPPIPPERIDAAIKLLRKNIDSIKEWRDTGPQMFLYAVWRKAPELFTNMDLTYYEGTANTDKTLQNLYDHYRDVIVEEAGGLENIKNTLIELARQKGKDFSNKKMTDKFLIECAIRMHYYNVFLPSFKSALAVTPYIKDGLFDDNEWMTSFDKEFYPNTCEQLKLFYPLQKKLTGYDEEAHHEEINRNVLKKQCDHIEKLLHKLNVNSQEKSNYLNFLNLFKLENVSDEALSQHRQQLKKYYEILKKAVTADTALSSSEKGEFQSSLSRALRLSGVCKDQRLIADILVGLDCVRNCSSPPQRFDIIGTIHVSEKEELELRKFNTFSPDPNPNGSVRRLVKKPGLHHEVDHEFSECLKDIIKALAKKRKIEFPSINPGKIGTFSYKVRNKGEIEVTVANKENNKTSAAAIRPCLNK